MIGYSLSEQSHFNDSLIFFLILAISSSEKISVTVGNEPEISSGLVSSGSDKLFKIKFKLLYKYYLI